MKKHKFANTRMNKDFNIIIESSRPLEKAYSAWYYEIFSLTLQNDLMKTLEKVEEDGNSL
jgi:hypothetical protein